MTLILNSTYSDRVLTSSYIWAISSTCVWVITELNSNILHAVLIRIVAMQVSHSGTVAMVTTMLNLIYMSAQRWVWCNQLEHVSGEITLSGWQYNGVGDNTMLCIDHIEWNIVNEASAIFAWYWNHNKWHIGLFTCI